VGCNPGLRPLCQRDARVGRGVRLHRIARSHALRRRAGGFAAGRRQRCDVCHHQRRLGSQRPRLQFVMPASASSRQNSALEPRARDVLWMRELLGSHQGCVLSIHCSPCSSFSFLQNKFAAITRVTLLCSKLLHGGRRTQSLWVKGPNRLCHCPGAIDSWPAKVSSSRRPLGCCGSHRRGTLSRQHCVGGPSRHRRRRRRRVWPRRRSRVQLLPLFPLRRRIEAESARM
jgi:hypothetical protein